MYKIFKKMNIYENTTKKLSYLMFSTKRNTLFITNISACVGILLQTLLAIYDYISYTFKFANVYDALIKNTHIIIGIIFLPVFILFAKCMSNTKCDKHIILNINILLLFIFSLLISMLFISEGAVMNYLQSVGIVAIIMFISGLTRNTVHTIASFVVSIVIIGVAVYIHRWNDMYFVILTKDSLIALSQVMVVSSSMFYTQTHFEFFIIIFYGIVLLFFTLSTTATIKYIREKVPKIISDIQTADKEFIRLQGVESAVKKIQSFSLPHNTTKIWNYTFNSVMIPSNTFSGDFFDIVPTPNQELVFWIGDVAGHSIEASITMAHFQSMINSCFKLMTVISYDYIDLKFMYDTINHIYYTEMIRKQKIAHPISFLLCKISRGRLYYIGQHEDFLIKSKKYKSKNSHIIVKNTIHLGVPFGLTEDISEFTKIESIPIIKGDSLLFLTDGILDLRDKNNNIYGIDSIIKSFSNEKNINTIVSDAVSWTDNTINDDVTLLHLDIK